MNHRIIYRPYQSNIYFAIAIIACGIFSLIALGHCLLVVKPITFLFAGMCILSFWLAQMLINSAQQRLIFEPEGIHATGGKNNGKFVPWNKFTYAYFERNYKGHLFLVLSPQMLHSQQTKSLTNRGANTSRIFVDNACVIFLNNSSTSLRIEELIKQTVLHIDVYQV